MWAQSLDALRFANFALAHFNDACDSEVHWSASIMISGTFSSDQEVRFKA